MGYAFPWTADTVTDMNEAGVQRNSRFFLLTFASIVYASWSVLSKLKHYNFPILIFTDFVFLFFAFIIAEPDHVSKNEGENKPKGHTES